MTHEERPENHEISEASDDSGNSPHTDDPEPAPAAAPRSYEELAARYAQALRLTFGQVELSDTVGELIRDGQAEGTSHADVPHWDVGHNDAFHDGHYDLHGDMPHWDHADGGDVLHGDITTLPGRPWNVLINEQRNVLHWALQLASRFEERLTVLEEIVARQGRVIEQRGTTDTEA
ncbi:hypothetical protein Skr01_59450 [Sphaerisporangium krabiense]|uniref:Uncharacterized protein n=1 Tax=Sphaerisporangium krabiense TaxID=763782 RepID=A0A7W8ZBI0_9ACTN|nr:hypothetical protein [Sphaerisporangium krabiense]MBB5630978.1 hypothetical protein [Sphaerisporangium krabiense]GII65860.1 hypothetical protein Skr01_59450 [Sphaerisporangium krabiense]